MIPKTFPDTIGVIVSQGMQIANDGKLHETSVGGADHYTITRALEMLEQSVRVLGVAGVVEALEEGCDEALAHTDAIPGALEHVADLTRLSFALGDAVRVTK